MGDRPTTSIQHELDLIGNQLQIFKVSCDLYFKVTMSAYGKMHAEIKGCHLAHGWASCFAFNKMWSKVVLYRGLVCVMKQQRSPSYSLNNWLRRPPIWINFAWSLICTLSLSVTWDLNELLVLVNEDALHTTQCIAILHFLLYIFRVAVLQSFCLHGFLLDIFD